MNLVSRCTIRITTHRGTNPMIDPLDRIDPDEARDDRQPFFTEALPCESCGKPCDELHVPYWDSDLHVGMCCAIHSDEWINDTEPTCEALYRLVSHCKTVAEVSDAFEVHAHSGCLICCPRKEAGAEVETKQERRAA